MCITQQDADVTVEVIKMALDRYRDRHVENKESVYFGAV